MHTLRSCSIYDDEKLEMDASVDAEDNIPEVLYAEDGRQFYPCLFCCHAFAIKTDQLSHMKDCTFKTVNRVPVAQPRPALNYTQRKRELPKSREIEHVVIKTEIDDDLQESSDSSIDIVQNNHNLDRILQNKALTVIKKVPTNVGFPKIKLKFQQEYQKIDTADNLSDSGESNNQTPPKLYFTNDELKKYHELFRKTDMSKCTICFKAVGRGCWYRHLKTHCIEKNYDCNWCDKKFGRKDHRDLHERTHTTRELKH